MGGELCFLCSALGTGVENGVGELEMLGTNINVFGSRDVALQWSLVEEKLSCGNNAQVLKK